MRAVIQRVNSASVTVDGKVTGQINRGLLVLLGITTTDNGDDLRYLVDKIVNMRIFPALDGTSGFDQSVLEIGGAILLISQFTLYASTRKGRRPGFTDAAPPEFAAPMFQQAVGAFRMANVPTETGVFGAMMTVELENSGPATFIVDTTDRNQPRHS